MNLVYANALLLLLVIAEVLAIRYVKNEPIPWKEIITNINSGHILLWIFRSLSIAAYSYVLIHSTGITEKWHYAAEWIFAFVLWDFCFYWSHRLHHQLKLLWAVHIVHHEGEHFNLSLGIRNSWYSSITSFPFFAIMAFAGIPLEIFISVSGIHYFIQFYNHSNLVKKTGLLEYILITPSHHRVHHGRNDPYLNKNFGGTFILWDKLFNTFQAEKPDTPVEYGIHDKLITENPILINNSLFLRKSPFFNRLLNGNERKYFLPNVLTVSGCLILFSLLLCFITLDASIAGWEKFLLFIIIFLGTIGNGGLSEGKTWGIICWTISTIILGFIYLLAFDTKLTALNLCLSVSIGHGILILLYTSPKKKSSKIKVLFPFA